MPLTRRIAPCSGVAFGLRRGQRLRVIAPEGEQVADMVAYNREDLGESLSSGRSLDYASRIFLGEGDRLYSNRSQVMLRIVEDEVGRHDFLLAPCSAEMFRLLHGIEDHPPRGCLGNLAAALAPWGIAADAIPTAFNVFMNVAVDAASGKLRVEAPLARPGQATTFAAEMDLVVGLTACSSPASNNGRTKPIDFEILDAD